MQKVIQMIKAMAEIHGRTLSAEAAKVLIIDLLHLPESAILEALSRCRMELRTFPTTADILSRISDGRPGVEEAWAMIPKDEYGSVVWSDEMREAFGSAYPLLNSGDEIAARMAFKEKYQSLVTLSRSNRKPPDWSLSQGFDKSGRIEAVQKAISQGRIQAPQAVLMLPEWEEKQIEISTSVASMIQIPEMPKF